MSKKRKAFEQKGFDEKEYKRYFHLKQAEYIRKKLRCVKLYSEGNSFDEISVLLRVHHQSVRKYVNIYISGGFEALCQADIRPQKSQLDAQQAASFKTVLLTQRPCEVGLEGNIWTGKLMCAYLQKTYGVVYKSGIYDLLERLNLTHQKAHSDYGNADIEEQIAFIETLKNTLLQADAQRAVLKFDEFSISEKPSAYYGWAEKNTRPKVVTNEKKGKERMDS